MDYKQNLIRMAKAYKAEHGYSLTYISNHIVGNSDFFENLEKGGDCKLETYQRALKFFNENKSIKELRRDKRGQQTSAS